MFASYCSGSALICRNNRPDNSERSGSAGQIPAHPGRKGAADHLTQIVAAEPREFFGEHGDAFSVGARHAGNVGAPEAAARTERIEDAADRGMDVAPGIG